MSDIFTRNKKLNLYHLFAVHSDETKITARFKQTSLCFMKHMN